MVKYYKQVNDNTQLCIYSASANSQFVALLPTDSVSV